MVQMSQNITELHCGEAKSVENGEANSLLFVGENEIIITLTQ